MPIFEVSKSYYTDAAEDTFAVRALKDISGNDLTHYIEETIHFRNHSDLKTYLSQALKIPQEDIYVLDMM